MQHEDFYLYHTMYAVKIKDVGQVCVEILLFYDIKRENIIKYFSFCIDFFLFVCYNKPCGKNMIWVYAYNRDKRFYQPPKMVDCRL